ncbi:helix-turn-helix domain-containing protein [Pectobacterium punjabense]|uniref:transcriptional regulator n=1 Tax=Pectobacterium punjabense TaxID=2108399 RepID=UPI00311FE0B1
MKNTAIQKAIAIAGSQKELGKRCGKAQSTICDWLNGKKKISPEHVPALVDATGGQVLAHEFRPDLPSLFPSPNPTDGLPKEKEA